MKTEEIKVNVTVSDDTSPETLDALSKVIAEVYSMVEKRVGRVAYKEIEDNRVENALEFIMQFGATDGDHHRQWALNQIVRILTGCTEPEVFIFQNGQEIVDDDTGESYEYHEWLRQYADGEDGPHTYSWDIGTAP